MKKLPKIALAVLVLLITCTFITTHMLTPESKVTKAPSSGKTTSGSHPSNSGFDSDAVIYKNVTPEVFNCMKKKLETIGVQVPKGNEGNIEGHGVKVHFKWDGVAKLALSVKDKPWYVSHDTLTGKIHDFIIECGGN